MTDSVSSRDESPSYSYRPSLIGAPWMFRLLSDRLQCQKGPRTFDVPYANVTNVRMAFRPVSTQTRRFVTEIRANGAPKITIVSVSWKSMVEQERLDAAYVAFVTELHKRLAECGDGIRYSRGIVQPFYWVGLLATAAAGFGVAMLAVRAVQVPSWPAAIMIAIFLAVFLWYAANYLRRNWPGRYRPQDLPPEVLPPAG